MEVPERAKNIIEKQRRPRKDGFAKTPLFQGVNLVTTDAVRQYIALLWKRYQTLKTRQEKSDVLDELCRNLSRHRKSALRLMNSHVRPRLGRGPSKAPSRAYSDESRVQLEQLWRLIGYPNSRRLKSALKDWLPDYHACDLPLKEELLAMHPRTMDRYLKSARSDLRRRLNTGTRAGKLIITQVPLKNFGERPTCPGHCEVDTVAHCGGSLSGTHHWTVNLTDILTGWTESESIASKSAIHVKRALELIEKRLPFRLIALYFDNGSEFINELVVVKFAQENRAKKLEVFRGRPYRKNDQACIEQKNYTHVRQIMGYDRLSGKVILNHMNTIYRTHWRELQNFCLPQSKLVKKIRIGARVRRFTDEPATPFARLMAWKELPPEVRGKLEEQRNKLNPFELRRMLTGSLRRLRRVIADDWTEPYHGRFHDKVS